MEQYIIKGGNPLVGEVEISGAKNAALGILAAAIMTDNTVLIENLPNVRDINVMLEAMAKIGVRVERLTSHAVLLNGSGIGEVSVDYEYIKKIRASYYLLGALLGKYKKAEVPLPGGCNIGSRPIDLHLKGFKALGARVSIRNGAICAEAEKLRGSHIYLDTVSVGATINIMMAASMADGYTIIENCAREPHVVDVANFLNSMGANIKGAGTDVASGGDYSQAAGDRMRGGGVRRRGPRGGIKTSHQHECEDASLPGLSHRYAAPDRRGVGVGRRNQHCDREHIRESFQIYG